MVARLYPPTGNAGLKYSGALKRIAIIGSGGSGKSTLAVQLGKALDLPVYHLDKLYWNPGWIQTNKEDWEKIQRRICAETRWVIDGNYGGTMDLRIAACDTLVFLDLPKLLCIFRVLKRALRYRNSTRPDMADDCPERITGEFIRWIWDYPKTRKPAILRKLADLKDGKKVVVLNSRPAIRRFVESLEPKH